MPPRGRPTLVVLSLVTSSSVASFSSASSCDAAACRSLVLAASFAFRRNSVLLAAYPGPSSLSSSPRARTTFLTPTPIICLQVMLLLRSTLSSNTRASTDDAGAGVPFGCIVTSDNWISTYIEKKENTQLTSKAKLDKYNCLFLPGARTAEFLARTLHQSSAEPQFARRRQSPAQPVRWNRCSSRLTQ